MKKKVSMALAAVMAASVVSTVCMAEESEFLTMIPNYNNEIGTFAKGPNGEDAVPATEIEMTEEQYIQFVVSSKITFEFAADKNTATVTYDQGPGEVGGQGVFVVLYKIKGTAIVFYDSQEDMEKEIPAHKYGLLAGSTFELSADKTTIIQTNTEPGIGTFKYKYSVAVK